MIALDTEVNRYQNSRKTCLQLTKGFFGFSYPITI